MKTRERVPRELRSDLTRVVAVDGGSVVTPLGEPYTTAREQIDGGNEFEGGDGRLAFYRTRSSAFATASAPRIAISSALFQSTEVESSSGSSSSRWGGMTWVSSKRPVQSL